MEEPPTRASRKRGRPPRCPRWLVELIIQMQRQPEPMSYGQICIALNAKRVPTPAGGSRWQRAHVHRLLHTDYAKQIAAELAPTSHDT